MEYQVQTGQNGEFHVVRLQPVIVARCEEEAMANTIASKLNDSGPEPAPPPALHITDTNDVRGKERPDKVQSAEEEPKTLTGDELTVAFDKIRAGCKISEVAGWYGTTFAKLRGQWAAQCRLEKAEPSTALVPVAQKPVTTKTSFQGVKDAIQQVADHGVCTKCQRRFEMTPDRLDTCARCAAEGY